MMETRCKDSAGGQREGEVEEDRGGGGGGKPREGSLVRFPVFHHISHLLHTTGHGGMKGTTVA